MRKITPQDHNMLIQPQIQNNRVVKFSISLAFLKRDKSSSFMGKVIAWWTKSKYYHTEFIINNRWVSSMPKQGIVIRELKPLKDKYDYKTFTFQLEYEHYTRFIKWIENQEGKKYDFVGIVFSQILPFNIDSNNRWFCSELCTKALQLVGSREVYEYKPSTVSPGKLAKLVGVE